MKYMEMKLLEYGFNENKLNHDIIFNNVQMKSSTRMQSNWKYPHNFKENISRLNIKWVTYEEILSVIDSDYANSDITDFKQAKDIWQNCKKEILDIL